VAFSPLPLGPWTRKSRISCTVDPGLLDEFDQFCEDNVKSRSDMVSRSMRALINGAGIYTDLKLSTKEASK
jgi:metal-responsive CopG/Arc/MetJ family transcriptional regulator